MIFGHQCPNCWSDKCEVSIKRDKDCGLEEKKVCLLCYDCGYSEVRLEKSSARSIRQRMEKS